MLDYMLARFEFRETLVYQQHCHIHRHGHCQIDIHRHGHICTYMLISDLLCICTDMIILSYVCE